jgi:hypothetical protein
MHTMVDRHIIKNDFNNLIYILMLSIIYEFKLYNLP